MNRLNFSQRSAIVNYLNQGIAETAEETATNIERLIELNQEHPVEKTTGDKYLDAKNEINQCVKDLNHVIKVAYGIGLQVQVGEVNPAWKIAPAAAYPPPAMPPSATPAAPTTFQQTFHLIRIFKEF